MRFVLDASVAIAWCFKDEHAPLARAAAQLIISGATTVAPMIWWAEIRNAVLMGERRGRIDARQGAKFVADISQQRIDFDPLPQGDAVFALARRHRLTFYDACYLELAQRECIALATLDGALAMAAKVEGIALIDQS